MNRLRRSPAEPVPSRRDRTGSFAFDVLEGALALVREWAGAERRAVIVSGSHASGEAVWTSHGGRRVSLSDLDVYVVMQDSAAARAAEVRALRGRPGLAPRLLEIGLAAPLEAAFLTPAALERLPARPATLELRRHGRVVEGDPAWLERVPDYRPREIPEEEVTLLLENRAFELLWSRAALPDPDRLARLRARHAVLKVALDLAAIAGLESGEYAERAAGRVARARARARAGDPLEPDREALWTAALAWRCGPVEALAPGAGVEEWRRAARAWVGAWRPRSAAWRAGAGEDPYRQAVAFASRARARRRLRHALSFRARSGQGPPALDRWRYAVRGTPQHRLNATAAVLVLAAAESEPPRLTPPASRALITLGVVGRELAHDWERATVAAVRLWDRWVLDGQRTAGAA